MALSYAEMIRQRKKKGQIRGGLETGSFQQAAAASQTAAHAGAQQATGRISILDGIQQPSQYGPTAGQLQQRITAAGQQPSQMQQLITAQQTAQTEAREANEQRYQQILSARGTQAGAAEDRWNQMQQQYGTGQQGLQQAAQQRYADIGAQSATGQQAMYGEAAGRYGAMQDQSQQGYQGLYGDVAGRFGRMRGDLAQGYQQQYQTGMGMLEGAGTQAKADARAAWAGRQSQGMQNLASSGIGGTVGATMKAGYGRRSDEEERRINEGLVAQRLGAHERMSGAGLSAQERGGMAETSALANIRGEGLSAQERLAREEQTGLTGLRQGALGTQTALARERNVGLTGLEQGRLGQELQLGQARNQNLQSLEEGRLGFMERREDAYPDQTAFLQMQQLMGQYGQSGAAGSQYAGLAGPTPQQGITGVSGEGFTSARQKQLQAQQAVVRRRIYGGSATTTAGKKKTATTAANAKATAQRELDSVKAKIAAYRKRGQPEPESLIRRREALRKKVG